MSEAEQQAVENTVPAVDPEAEAVAEVETVAAATGEEEAQEGQEEEVEEEDSDDERSEDVPDDFEAYLSDGEEEHAEDEVQHHEVNQDVSCLLIVDQLPKVPADKMKKLTDMLTARVLPVKVNDTKIAPENVTMPFDEEAKLSMGFAIVEYATPRMVKAQLQKLDGFSKFNLNLKVYPYSTVRRLCGVPDTLEEKKVEDHPEYDFASKQTSRDLYHWLSDKRVRDQFVVRFGMETQIQWADTVALPQLAYGGEREKERDLNWCEMHVKWSPFGTYLLTQHFMGVALWGGPRFEKVLRIPCQDVKRVQFSPNETFLMTWNGGGQYQDDSYGGYQNTRPGRKAVTLWNIWKGAYEKVKSFDYEVFTRQMVGPEWDTEDWNYFKWSSDDRYFARIAYADVEADGSASSAPEDREPNILRVYDSTTLKSQSIVAKGIRSCEWSPGTGPKDNIIAYWEPEMKKKSRHASVTLRQYPSRKLLRQQTLYNVSDCTIHWQNRGDFMCAHVERHTASKKTYFTNLELFRVRDRDIPVETLEIRETVHAFAWEPNGVRFCVIHGSTSNTVSIYTMHAITHGDAYALLWQIDNKKCTGIYWSPVGRHAVLAGKGQGSYHGALEFIDTDDKELLNSAEHFMCKHVLWDSGGRTVATAATLPMPRPGSSSQSSDLERGYRLWTFQGDLLSKHDERDFYQFCWRPRPKSLLDEEAREKVVKNMGQMSRKYKDQDRLLQESNALEKAKEKSSMRASFHDTMKALHEWYLKDRDERVRINGYDETTVPVKEEKFDIEHVLDEKREVYRFDEDDE